MIIREVENPKFKDLIKALYIAKAAQSELNKKLLADVFLVGSGKGALALVLKYLIANKVIVNKTDEILVPSWLGYWVYNQMQPYVFLV